MTIAMPPGSGGGIARAQPAASLSVRNVTVTLKPSLHWLLMR